MSGIVIGHRGESSRTHRSRGERTRVALGLGLCAGVFIAAAPSASGAPVRPTNGSPVSYWTGNGVTSDGEDGYLLTSPQCDADDTPYLLFVLAGSKATVASLSIDGSSAPMSKANGTKKGVSSFKYTYSPDGSIDLADLLGDGSNVYATHNDSRDTGTLTISHGCTGGTGTLTGLTIQFRPVDSGQDVGYCVNSSEEAVCDPIYADRWINWGTFVSTGGVLQEYNIALSTLTSENAVTGLFGVSVNAPGPLPDGSKIGPGVGVTCQQRVGATMAGTENGAVSADTTGAGFYLGVQWYYYWYTGCSLDPGVAHAYFYAYTGALQGT